MAKMAVLIQRYYDDSADNGDNLAIRNVLLFKSVADAKKYLNNKFKQYKNSGWKKSYYSEYISIYDREDKSRYHYFDLYEKNTVNVD